MSRPDLVLGTYAQGRAMVGKAFAPRRGAFPVSQALVQLFCGVTEDANPGYWDEAYAQRQWGGLIAPPAMLMVWVAGLPWIPGGIDSFPPAVGASIPLPGDRLVNAVHEARLHQPIRVGDHLTITERVESLSEEKRTWLGVGHFITTRSRIVNDAGVLVAEQSNQLFRYTAAAREGEAEKSAPMSAEAVSAGAVPIPGITLPDITLPDITLDVTRFKAIMVPATTLDYLPGHYDPASPQALHSGGLSLNTPQLLGLFNRHATDWAGPDAFIASQRLRIVRPLVEGTTARVCGEATIETAPDGGRTAMIRSVIKDSAGSIVARCEITLRLGPASCQASPANSL